MSEENTAKQLVNMLCNKSEITIMSDIVHGLNYEYEQLQKKYNKALSLLLKYNMPCEIDGFMDKNTDYCSNNCGVDDEIFKKCWDKYIEDKLKGNKE